MTTALDGYCTIDEAAKIIGVDRSQVSRYVQQGRLEVVLQVGRSKLLAAKAVEKFERPRPGPVPQKSQKR